MEMVEIFWIFCENVNFGKCSGQYVCATTFSLACVIVIILFVPSFVNDSGKLGMKVKLWIMLETSFNQDLEWTKKSEGTHGLRRVELFY